MYTFPMTLVLHYDVATGGSITTTLSLLEVKRILDPKSDSLFCCVFCHAFGNPARMYCVDQQEIPLREIIPVCRRHRNKLQSEGITAKKTIYDLLFWRVWRLENPPSPDPERGSIDHALTRLPQMSHDLGTSLTGQLFRELFST
jgi:hypothetical protein